MCGSIEVLFLYGRVILSEQIKQQFKGIEMANRDATNASGHDTISNLILETSAWNSWNKKKATKQNLDAVPVANCRNVDW